MRLRKTLLLTVALACSPAGCGPPSVVLRDDYANEPGSAHADHSAFTSVLRSRVDADGTVDYAGLHADPRELDAYIAYLGDLDLDALGRDERLAAMINAYNAFTLRLILDHWPVDSIRSIPAGERWKARRWVLGGRTFSLDELEHEHLRPKFGDPRVHFAVNCASVGCPPLRREAYVGARIDAQLDDQARAVHRGARWFRLDAESGTVHLTRLYDWFGDDFRQVADSVLDFAARYSPELAIMLERGERPSIAWLDYDWSLNGRVAPR